MSEPDLNRMVSPDRSAPLRIASAKESADWSGLSEAENEAEYCSEWLSLQCTRTAGVTSGLLATRQATGDTLSIAALWPDRNVDLANLSRLVKLAYSEKRIAVFRNRSGSTNTTTKPGDLIIGVPLGVGEIVAVAAVSVTAVEGRAPPAPEAIAEQLRWGAGWLAALPYARRSNETSAKFAVATSCIDLLVSLGEQDRLQGMTIAIVNDLATRFQCDRVSLGVLKRNGAIRLRGISHSARFKNEGRLVDAIENAMEEAIDQRATVAYPALPPTARAVTMAHQALVDIVRGPASQLMSVVLPDGRGGLVGAITLERHRDEPFDEMTIRLTEAISSLIGPTLGQQLRANRLLSGRIVDVIGDGTSAILGRGRPGLKLAAISLVAIAVYLAFATGTHRVTATAVLEPETQRAAVAPFDGFISAAYVRAGDEVREGDLLALLDDRDLVLEEQKWRSERDKLIQEQRDALARHDRTSVGILASQIRQAEALLALAEAKVSRSRIIAPFDGLVVEGDLSQSLGSPVDEGEVLFEVAPLNAYRLIMYVDERDVRYVSVGQKGYVSLAGLPGDPLLVEVSKIMPVTVVEDGRNSIEVEGQLTEVASTLQPGMEGVAKIETGPRNLLWIWTHGVADAVRLAMWKYLP